MSNITSFIVTNAVIIDREDVNFQDGNKMIHYKLQHKDISENMDVYINPDKYSEATVFPEMGESPRVLVQSTTIWKDGQRTEGNRLRFRFKDF